MPTFTALTVEDACEVYTLQRAAYTPERVLDTSHKHLPALDQSLEDVAADLADTHMLCYGLRDEQQLVAAVRAYVSGSSVQIGRLCVSPRRQGQGLATSLLKQLEDVLPGHVHELHLFTDSDAVLTHHFYKKLGFQECKHEMMDAGFDIVELKKTLAAGTTFLRHGP